jgi:hypothetical protein
MHWWYKSVQICRPIECKGIHACCSGSPKNWEYLFSTLWLLLLANTSHVKGPHNLLNKLNILSLIPQSSKSKILLRKSVSTLYPSYRKPILYSKQFLQIEKASDCNSGFILPIFEILTTFWLSEYNFTNLFSFSPKVFKTKFTALSSLKIELWLLSQFVPYTMEWLCNWI